MKVSTAQKSILYQIATITLKWSLVYLLVLFFLEDSRPFMVSTVLNPAWLFVPLLLSLVGVLATAPYGHEHTTQTSARLTRLDIWLVRISFALLGVWLLLLIGFSFWSSVGIALLIVSGYYMTMQLFVDNS